MCGLHLPDPAERVLMSVGLSEIAPNINVDGAPGKVLSHVITQYPNVIEKRVLMHAAGLYEHSHGRLGAHVAFYNAILRANRELRHLGWSIDTVDACTPKEAFRIVRVHNRSAA